VINNIPVRRINYPEFFFLHREILEEYSITFLRASKYNVMIRNTDINQMTAILNQSVSMLRC